MDVGPKEPSKKLMVALQKTKNWTINPFSKMGNAWNQPLRIPTLGHPQLTRSSHCQATARATQLGHFFHPGRITSVSQTNCQAEIPPTQFPTRTRAARARSNHNQSRPPLQVDRLENGQNVEQTLKDEWRNLGKRVIVTSLVHQTLTQPEDLSNSTWRVFPSI